MKMVKIKWQRPELEAAAHFQRLERLNHAVDQKNASKVSVHSLPHTHLLTDAVMFQLNKDTIVEPPLMAPSGAEPIQFANDAMYRAMNGAHQHYESS
jgi:hypothetical protein